jgi:hypothetical protein
MAGIKLRGVNWKQLISVEVMSLAYRFWKSQVEVIKE